MLDQVRLGAKFAGTPVRSATMAVALKIVGQGSTRLWSGISSCAASEMPLQTAPSRMKGAE
jgi:hypothetical protein